jgi:hypothetical protein
MAFSHSSVVFPLHDPTGLLFPYLKKITPQLKLMFTQAFLSISPGTLTRQAKFLHDLEVDPFFVLNMNPPGSLAGDHYLAGYRNAVEHTIPDDVIHLCDLDKVAFLLLNNHRESFLADIGWANSSSKPVLFQRSKSAWATYPENYREIEHLFIRTGELIFKKYFDFAWSHLIVQSHLLRSLLPKITSHDFGILIEMVLLLQNELLTKDVDWLEWEDPFIFGRDPIQLSQERNNNHEIHKRLSGAIPFLQILLNRLEESDLA